MFHTFTQTITQFIMQFIMQFITQFIMMVANILFDFMFGIFESCRIDYVLREMYYNRAIMWDIIHIFGFNLTINLLCRVVLYYMLYISDAWYMILIYILLYAVHKLVDIVYHTVHYIDLLGKITSRRTKKCNRSIIDVVINIILMNLYQLSLCIFIYVIHSIPQYNSITDALGFIIINFMFCLYHALYAFNNWWQFYGVNPSSRIKVLETRWPFFVGFGLISTILCSVTNVFSLSIYNLYLSYLIMIPFISDNTKHIKKQDKYPPIKLKFITYISLSVTKLTLYLLKFSKK